MEPPRDPPSPASARSAAAVPDAIFIDGYALVYGMTHDDPKRLRLMMLEALDEAFPFTPACAAHPAAAQRAVEMCGAIR